MSAQPTTEPLVQGTWNVPPQKASSSKAIWWVAGLLCVAMLLCGGGLGGLILWRSRSTPTEPQKEKTSSTPPVAEPSRTTAKNDKAGSVTRDKFDRIKVGMMKNEVEKIMGSPGNEIYNGKGGDTSFLLLQWADEKFNTILINFENEKVTSKSEVGLDDDD